MSATPNNAAPGWDNARPPQPAAVKDTGEGDGHNALQGLLAFACIHQQAARRKREAQGPNDSPLRLCREEELALDEILQLVAVRAIVPVTGRPPNNAEAMLAAPWATSSMFERCRRIWSCQDCVNSLSWRSSQFLTRMSLIVTS